MSITLSAMTRYIALLRGINMAGHNPVKMDKLRACFESMNFKNVRTYIQSGNVIFESKYSQENQIAKKIVRGLTKSTGLEIAVTLRTPDELIEIVEKGPFKNLKLKSGSMPYVTFIANDLKHRPKLPLITPKEDLEILTYDKRNFFCVGHLVGNRRGFPNTVIEKEFKVPATTRNWNTVRKLADIAGR